MATMLVLSRTEAAIVEAALVARLEAAMVAGKHAHVRACKRLLEQLRKGETSDDEP